MSGRERIPAEHVMEALRELVQGYYDMDDQRGYSFGLTRRQMDYFQGPPVGGETLAVGAAVVGFAAIPDYARSAFVTVTGAPIRVGFARVPSATVGHHFAVGEHFTIVGIDSLQQFRAIQEGASGGTVDATYFA
jgi:hypothetical protein